MEFETHRTDSFALQWLKRYTPHEYSIDYRNLHLFIFPSDSYKKVLHVPSAHCVYTTIYYTNSPICVKSVCVVYDVCFGDIENCTHSILLPQENLYTSKRLCANSVHA